MVTCSRLREKMIDVVGLYLDPPMDAVVLSIDDEDASPGAGSDTAAGGR
jgi:hypothetical protein